MGKKSLLGRDIIHLKLYHNKMKNSLRAKVRGSSHSDAGYYWGKSPISLAEPMPRCVCDLGRSPRVVLQYLG